MEKAHEFAFPRCQFERTRSALERCFADRRSLNENTFPATRPVSSMERRLEKRCPNERCENSLEATATPSLPSTNPSDIAELEGAQHEMPSATRSSMLANSCCVGLWFRIQCGRRACKNTQSGRNSAWLSCVNHRRRSSAGGWRPHPGRARRPSHSALALSL